MNSGPETDTLQIRSDRIEFVLIAPFKGRDRIVLRSENAGPELVALAVDPLLAEHLHPGIMGTFMSSPNLHVVESLPTPDLEPESDGRLAAYRLAWKGRCTPKSKELISRSFNRAIPDVTFGIKVKNSSIVEQAFSPVLFGCLIAHQNATVLLRFRFVAIAVALAYMAAVILTIWRKSHG